jgi:phosphoribosylamine--glycine ligase
LLNIFQATIDGNLGRTNVEWSDQSSACVVLASAGYPGQYETGLNIEGLDQITANDNLQIFHAGTSKAASGDFVTAGGRVLGVTAAEATLEKALTSCYGAIDDIGWKGMQYRRDIGRFNESMKANS